MRTPVLALLAAATVCTLSGCRRGAQPEPEASAQAAPPEKTSKYRGAARDFAEKLTATPIDSYDPEVSGDAIMTYSELRFADEDAWRAQATVRLGDEPYDCVESGTWRVDADATTGADEGSVELSLDQTGCPGRNAPRTFRLLIRFKAGAVEVINR